MGRYRADWTFLRPFSVSRHDLGSLLAGGIDQCCQACSAHAGCKGWSYCNVPAPLACGTKAKPVDCYLKSAANATDGTTAFSDQRVSGSPGTALSGSISTVLTGLSWICVGIHSRRALPAPVCA